MNLAKIGLINLQRNIAIIGTGVTLMVYGALIYFSHGTEWGEVGIFAGSLILWGGFINLKIQKRYDSYKAAADDDFLE